MFTGIIEEVGTITAVQRGVKSSRLTIAGARIFEDLQLGDSVAVNGVCLTAASITQQTFTADVMQETLSRSSLGALSRGSAVNLERAMAANGRFGGHIVSGHIDGTGTISQVRSEGNAVWYTISASSTLLRYIIEKGSIAIDGISLTVAQVGKQHFSVSIIPHTCSNTTLSKKVTGDIVNLENDVVGKYIEKLISPADTSPTDSHITPEFLAKFGF